tara:strand:+ start:298 stop:798 length:501 start_codon:yes stop_codon:yes gene_type:complete
MPLEKNDHSKIQFCIKLIENEDIIKLTDFIEGDNNPNKAHYINDLIYDLYRLKLIDGYIFLIKFCIEKNIIINWEKLSKDIIIIVSSHHILNFSNIEDLYQLSKIIFYHNLNINSLNDHTLAQFLNLVFLLEDHLEVNSMINNSNFKLFLGSIVIKIVLRNGLKMD